MRYRKKPVTIEARQLVGPAAEWHAVYQWVEANTLGSFDMNQFWVDPENFTWPESGVSIDARDGRVVIATLEGGHWVNDGDWIIKGWAGEFYPCKPEIFEATYEKDFEEEDFEEEDVDWKAAAPAIAAKAWEEGYAACRNRPRVDGYLINRANPYQTRADRIERGES